MMTATLDRVLLVPEGIWLTKHCVRCSKHCAPYSSDAPDSLKIRGRGLCSPCYRFCNYWGSLYDHPRTTRSRDDLLDDYVILRAQGYDWYQIANRMDMTYSCFERAMLRARRDNDPRAARLNERGYPRCSKP